MANNPLANLQAQLRPLLNLVGITTPTPLTTPSDLQRVEDCDTILQLIETAR